MSGITAYENDTDESLEKMVLDNKNLVRQIAFQLKRRLPSHIDLDDLYQSGIVGLLEAHQHYQSNMGATFKTYASIRIRGAMIDGLRKNSWISRDTIKNMKRIGDAIAIIEQREQQHASSEEIAKELGISIDEYAQIAQDVSMYHVMNIEEIGEQHYLTSDEAQAPDDITHRDFMKKNLIDVLKTLPEREQLVLSLYYVEELTFKQIGEVLDLTEARICQLHASAVSRVRKKMKIDE